MEKRKTYRHFLLSHNDSSVGPLKRHRSESPLVDGFERIFCATLPLGQTKYQLRELVCVLTDLVESSFGRENSNMTVETSTASARHGMTC